MVQTSLSPSNRVIDERTTNLFSFQLQDSDGNFLTDADLDTLTLTLYNESDDTIINSRDSQNVLDANNVTVSSASSGSTAGEVVWTMQPADNQIVSSNIAVGELENHIALFEWTWDSGGRSNRLETRFLVRNLGKVP